MLEENIAVLVGAAHHGALGVEGALAEGLHGVHVHHVGQILVVPDGDLLDLVGGTEAVEEVHERTRPLMAARWATAPRSMTSWGLDSHSMAKPVWRQAMTSEWSPKMFSAWVATVRADT